MFALVCNYTRIIKFQLSLKAVIMLLNNVLSDLKSEQFYILWILSKTIKDYKLEFPTIIF